MIVVPPIDLRELRQQVEIFHRLAGSLGVSGELRLVADGLDPQGAGSGRPRPLPVVEQAFAIGAIEPMVETAARLNREPGRNVRLAPVIFAAGSDEVLAVFGFCVELLREAGWIGKLPFAPAGAVAAGGKVWALFLLDPPLPAEQVRPVAQQIHDFASAQGRIDLRRGAPLAGGVFWPPAESSAAVELELPWRPGCSLDHLSLEPGGPQRVALAAMRPDAALGSASRQGGASAPGAAARATGSAGEDHEDPGVDDNGAEEDIGTRLGRFALRLRAGHRRLEVGSDVEIAQCVGRELAAELGSEIVHAEGDLWFYSERAGCWTALEHDLLRRLVHAFDGASYAKPNGRDDAVQLGKSRVGSVAHELAAMLAIPDFFDDGAQPLGLNCRNGFLRFDDAGEVELTPHRPEHRQRHTIEASWDRWLAEAAEDPPRESLLARLIEGCFGEDPDREAKCRFVAEMLGAAATGCVTRLPRPRAVICFGASAENGKSQILDTMRAMLPAAAVAAIPANRFGDDKHLVHLRNKLLNARDELTSAAVIASDQFKSTITGEPISGRDVYRSVVNFRSRAFHIFATNVLPSFTGGFDPGVRSRLAMLAFDRVIPVPERIPGLGRRIAAEEGDLLLAFAVAGAQRLLRQRAFTVPPSSAVALKDWFLTSDPVAAWAKARLRPRNPAAYLPGARDFGIPSSDLFADFDRWQQDAGFGANLKLPGFSRRLLALAPFLKTRHAKTRNFIRGGMLGDPPDADGDDDDERMLDEG